jgi:hypothetical protein
MSGWASSQDSRSRKPIGVVDLVGTSGGLEYSDRRSFMPGFTAGLGSAREYRTGEQGVVAFGHVDIRAAVIDGLHASVMGELTFYMRIIHVM